MDAIAQALETQVNTKFELFGDRKIEITATADELSVGSICEASVKSAANWINKITTLKLADSDFSDPDYKMVWFELS